MAFNENILSYKGQPLVRDGNKIYYGDPAEKYLLVLTILENKTVGANSLPSRILVQVWDTNPELAFKKEKIVKESEKKDLYDALDIGIIWLERLLKK